MRFGKSYRIYRFNFPVEADSELYRQIVRQRDAMQTFNSVKSNQLRGNQFSILLVEDDDVDVMNVQRALRKNNLAIPMKRAANGLEALDILKNGRFKPSGEAEKVVVLLDLNMPKMGGLEFLKILRNNDQLRKTPVIILTTSDQDQDLSAAYDLNVAGYIVKPVDFKQFVEMVDIISRYWSICVIPD